MKTETKTYPTDHPLSIVQALLEPAVGEMVHSPSQPALMQRVVSLDHDAPRVLTEAKRTGVELEYLGIHPLFDQNRLYEGVGTNWVCGPITKDHHVVVPRDQLADLKTLHAAGVHMPLVYEAHEVEEHKSSHLLNDVDGYAELDHKTATALIGPVPDAAQSVELGDRLAQRTTQVISGVKRGLTVAGTVVAAPVILAGKALEHAPMDPIVIGAVPAFTATPGSPAAFYALVAWEW